MHVLIFTPTWERADGSLAMRPETREAVESQVSDGRVTWDWIVSTHNPFPGETHRNVLAQYQKAREIFLAGSYDALLTFEHDMTMPPDALLKLTATKADVVYGVYLLRHGSLVLNAWEYIGDRNLGESLTLMPEKLALARKQGAVRVCGCGFGCTLIHRHVLEKLEMHGEPDDPDQVCPDIPLARDCLREGFVSMARFDVACDHFDKEVRLRPFDGAVADRVPVRANASMNIAVISMTMQIRENEVYLLPRDVASEMSRAGYVSLVDNSPTEAREPETATLGALETMVMHAGRKKRKGQL